jgi:hypothetical protein
MDTVSRSTPPLALTGRLHALGSICRRTRARNPLGISNDGLAMLAALHTHPVAGLRLVDIRGRTGIPKEASLYTAQVLADAGVVAKKNESGSTPGDYRIRRYIHLTITPDGVAYLAALLS